MENIELVKIFSEIADILELKNANTFRIAAYRRAAQSIETLPHNIKEYYLKNQLNRIPGIGKNLAQHIVDLISVGKSKELENIKKGVPMGLIELMRLNNLGPKRVRFLYKKFQIKSIKQLKNLLKTDKLLKTKGWGKRSIKNLIHSIAAYEESYQRFPLGEIYLLVENILKQLRSHYIIGRAEIGGSFRRAKDTVGDLDFLATSHNPKSAINLFCHLPQVKEILAQGPTKANVLLNYGIEADLRVVTPESFGAAWHYFTGSKEHNIAIRKMGIKNGLLINEYGVYRINKKTGRKTRISGQDENDIFRAIDLPWIPPEIRENAGEIEVGQKGKLPKLINLSDIKGDCHIHSNYSDGQNKIIDLVKAAQKQSYQYIAITDHASPIGIVNSMTEKKIIKQVKEIRKINQNISGFKILTGIEVDINKDGSLYLPDKILSQFDMVIASIHSYFNLPPKEMTKRILRALDNPYVKILGHPTGREINHREPYSFDWSLILQIIQKNNQALELNSSYSRLDLNSTNCRQAKNFGIKIIISTDSHNISELSMMKFGIATARRGWLEKKDVINAWTLSRLAKFFSLKI